MQGRRAAALFPPFYPPFCRPPFFMRDFKKGGILPPFRYLVQRREKVESVHPRTLIGGPQAPYNAFALEGGQEPLTAPPVTASFLRYRVDRRKREPPRTILMRICEHHRYQLFASRDQLAIGAHGQSLDVPTCPCTHFYLILPESLLLGGRQRKLSFRYHNHFIQFPLKVNLEKIGFILVTELGYGGPQF